MPCCCKDNVQACFVLGIILVVLNLLSSFGLIFACISDEGMYPYLLIGIFGALVSGLLIYGAHKRNRTAILIWMVLTIIGVIGLIIASVWVIYAIVFASDSLHELDIDIDIDAEGALGMAVLSVIIAGIFILFEIWTIIVFPDHIVHHKIH